MDLPILTPTSAPDRSRPVLSGVADNLGFVPNIAGVAANSPTLLAVFDGMRRAVGDIDPVLRETAGVAVGVAVDNEYGVAFHSTVLGRLGVDPAEIDRMRAGEAPSDPRLAAGYDVAREVVVGRGKVGDAVIDRARAAGLSDVDILDVVAESAFASVVGLIDNLAGRVALDEFLVPQAWKK